MEMKKSDNIERLMMRRLLLLIISVAFPESGGKPLTVARTDRRAQIRRIFRRRIPSPGFKLLFLDLLQGAGVPANRRPPPHINENLLRETLRGAMLRHSSRQLVLLLCLE
jgi:hypothetical protein